MNRITMYLNASNEIVGFVMRGHANYAEAGKDIVCSALSVLSQNTYFSLIRLTGLEHTEIVHSADPKRGVFRVQLPEKMETAVKERALLFMKSFELGVSVLTETYPQYVTLRYRRC